MSLQILAARALNTSNLKQLGFFKENSQITFIPSQIKDDLNILLDEEAEKKAILERRFDLLKAIFKQKIFENQKVFDFIFQKSFDPQVFDLILQQSFDPHLNKTEAEKIISCIEEEHLLKQINTLDDFDNSLLMLALEVEEIAFAKALLKRKTLLKNILHQNFFKNKTALIIAVEIYSPKLVEKILDAVFENDRIDFLTVKNCLKKSAISIAIDSELEDILKVFIKKVAIESKTKKGDTILHAAAKIGDVNFIHMILDLLCN